MNLEKLEQKARDKYPYITGDCENGCEIETFLNCAHRLGYRYIKSYNGYSGITIIVERMA